jgi:PleD family two-component response regulator
VERFGELTFGVFYNGDVVDVEPWAERLQDEMSATDGLLAGGVSIGVAMLRDETQSPEALREDATEALWMAYETGTCTIVE